MSLAKVSETNHPNIDAHGSLFNKTFLLVTILTGSFIAVLNQTILSTALPQLITYFQINTSQVQWVTTAYMLTNGIMIPMTALLLEKISTRKLFIFAMTVFGLGTTLCAICPNYEILLLGRVCQAIGAGILMPLVNTVIVLVFPVEKRGMAMGFYGLVISFGPAIGPIIAGFVIDYWNWHYLFYCLLPIVALNILFAFFFMKDIIPTKKVKLDIISIMLSSLGFGLLLFGFSSAGSKGWSNPITLGSIVLGFAISVAFVIRQYRSVNPMLQLKVFKSKAFSITTIVGSVLNITHVGATVMLPIFIQSVLGETALTTGLVLLPGAVIMSVIMLLAGQIYDKYGARCLVIPGIILIIVSSIRFATLSMDASIMSLTIFNALRFMGLGLVFMTLQTAGINALSNDLVHHASAVVNTTRQIMGAIGTAILITIMTSVENSNAPVMAESDLRFQGELLNATIHGINAAFLCIIGVGVFALIVSFFLEEKKKHLVRQPREILMDME